jgi:hypothetical protein
MPVAPSVASPQPNARAGISHLSLPHALLQEQPVLGLAPTSRGGLILRKSFYADFVSAGAAIGGRSDQQYTEIYVIGQVKLQTLLLPVERQRACQRRMACIQTLARISSTPSSPQRALLIVNQLCDWVGIGTASEIPVEWVASLAGVLPKTVRQAWQKYWQDCHLFTQDIRADGDH